MNYKQLTYVCNTSTFLWLGCQSNTAEQNNETTTDQEVIDQVETEIPDELDQKLQEASNQEDSVLQSIQKLENDVDSLLEGI